MFIALTLTSSASWLVMLACVCISRLFDWVEPELHLSFSSVCDNEKELYACKHIHEKSAHRRFPVIWIAVFVINARCKCSSNS